MKTIKTLSFLAFALTLAVGCAQRGEDVDPGMDAGSGSGSDAGDDLTVDPPAESASWACRSGVDAEGNDYMEFNPQYLNNATEATAFVVGQAPGESIVGYFTGSYRQGVIKNAKSGWYRINLQGTSDGILTYARCVDTVGGNASCWAQYGLPLPAANAGPYRTCPSGNSCACKFKPVAGEPAQALGGQ